MRATHLFPYRERGRGHRIMWRKVGEWIEMERKMEKLTERERESEGNNR